jgi:hypothetical protein
MSFSEVLDGRRVKSAFRFALPIIVLVELLSYCGQYLTAFSAAAFVIVVGLTAILAFYRFDLACLTLLAELFVGSQGGYHFAAGWESGTVISLRIGLFMAVFCVWAAGTGAKLIHWARRGERPEMAWLNFLKSSGLLWPYLALLGVFAFAAMNGIWRGNGFDNTFFDANGYAYFAVLPALIDAWHRPHFRDRAVGVMLAAVAATTLKALFVLYIFSHRMFFVAAPLYVWVRDTRVGEITRMVGDFYRVFFQAHLFSLIAAFPSALLFAFGEKRWRRVSAAVFALCLVGVVMGFSRSFWFGAFSAAIALAVMLLRGRAGWPAWRSLMGLAAIGIVVSGAVIYVTYAVPFPRKGASVSLASLLGERAFSVSGEAAANSRWALLPILNQAALKHPILGSGFGTTVTYRTSDPRLLADIPTGEWTTFAFEWGYHDLWLKLGFVGLAVYGWFIYRLAKPLLIRLKQRGQLAPGSAGKEGTAWAVGLLLVLVALLATNVFSPYLNHPLGIGLLALVGLAARAEQSK